MAKTYDSDNSLEADTNSRPDSETFGSIFLKLSADFKKRELFKGIRKSIFEISIALDG